MNLSPRIARRAISIAAVAGAAALATGCGSVTPSASAAPRAQSHHTASHAGRAKSASAADGAAGTPAGSVTDDSAGGGASATAAPACQTSHLRVYAGQGSGAAGSTDQEIDFRNVGGGTCTLFGYPGVSLVGGKPLRQIGLAASRDAASPPRLITLKPGRVANALIDVVDVQNYPAGRCHPVHAKDLRIYPPNQKAFADVRYPVLACAKDVNVLSTQSVRKGAGNAG